MAPRQEYNLSFAIFFCIILSLCFFYEVSVVLIIYLLSCILISQTGSSDMVFSSNPLILQEIFDKVSRAYEYLCSSKKKINGPDPENIVLILKAQSILFKRYKDGVFSAHVLYFIIFVFCVFSMLKVLF